MEYKESRVRYLCDGEVESCKKKSCYETRCYKGRNAGEAVCKHTKDIRHAKNFKQLWPDIPQANFWEKDPASDGRRSIRIR